MADAAQPTDRPGKRLFCTSQRLSLLGVRTDVRPYLSGERFWQERDAALRGDKAAPSPWEPVDRWQLARRLTAGGDVRRLAVVCAAGLGKSTNLGWLAKELAAPRLRQVPFLFELDDKGLPRGLDDFWKVTLPDRIARVRGNGGVTRPRVRFALARYRAQGRITLLFDSIDQASRRGLRLVRAALSDGNWKDCPVVISARPHAVFEQWDELIGAGEQDWRFVRIEPLAEEQQEVLLNQGGQDRYRHVHRDGRRLLGNPRTIEYVRRCPVSTADRPHKEPTDLSRYTLRDLRTGSHVFAGAVQYLIECGMAAPDARRLGLRPDATPSEDLVPGQVDYAHNLLAALAYTMYCSRSPGGEGPNVSHIPPGKPMEMFLKKVRRRLIAAGVRRHTYALQRLHEDIKALGALNTEIHYDLLDTRPKRRGVFRWHDRSLQEFYAAWWLSRFAGEKDVERLRKWRYDDPWDDEKKSLYEPLWGYLVEMPRAVRRAKAWLPCVKVLFEPGVARCCEMIYRAWPTLKRSQAGRAVIEEWQREFQQLLHAEGPIGAVARQIPEGLRPIDAGLCPFGADPLASPPQPGVERFVKAFRLHRWPVTNEMYELFDPGHFAYRWGSQEDSHPLAGPDGHGDDRCPVVNVTWYNAWCYAAWCGCRLPAELEWEHALRKGAATAWFFGDDEEELKKYALYGQDPNSSATLPVDDGARLPNANGLQDMTGNVWEWCEDRWAPAASARVLRGGSWFNGGGLCRSAYRVRLGPDFRNQNFGFRLAVVPASLEHSERASGA
jgi:hypothetical protein